jgi:hypothetical protein
MVAPFFNLADLTIMHARRPIFRSPPTVGDRDHANDIPIATEYERIWEATQRNATVNFVELLSEGRQFGEYADDALNLQHELVTQPKNISLINIRSFH